MPHTMAMAIDTRRGRIRIGGIGRRYAEHAPHAAFHTADDTTDRATNYGPNRSSRLAAHVSAVGYPIGNALGPCRERASK